MIEFEIKITDNDVKTALDAIPADARKAGAAIADSIGAGAKKAGSAVTVASKAGTSGMQGLAASAGKAAAGLGTVATAALSAGAAFGSLVAAQNAAAREVETLAARTGLAADTLAGLRAAAIDSGRALDDIAPEDLAVRIKEAAEGTGDGAAAFQLLGVAARDTDGTLRSSDAVFRDIIDKLSTMEDRTLAAALADELFSDQGTRLLATLEGGSAELDRFTSRAAEFGFAVGEGAAETTRDWTEGIGAMQLALETAAQDVIDFAANVGVTGDRLKTAALGLVFWSSLLGEGTNLITETEVALARAEYRAFRFWLAYQEGVEAAEEAGEGAARANDRVIVGVQGAAEAAAKLEKSAWDAVKSVESLENASRSFWAAWVEVEQGRLIDRGFDPLTNNLQAAEEQAERATEALDIMGERFQRAYDEDRQAREEWETEFRAWHDFTTAAAEAVTEVWVRAASRRASAAAESASAAITAEEDLQSQLADLYAQRDAAETERERSRLDAEIVAMTERVGRAQEFTEIQKEEALKAWKANKAAQASSAAINAAAAAALAFATIPWPGSILAAAAAAAAALAEVAAITSEPPPEFPIGTSGLSPDHFAVGVQAGEAILTRRAAAAVGRDEIERWNAGQQPAMEPSIYLGRRQLREVVRGVGRERPGSRYGKGRGRR